MCCPGTAPCADPTLACQIGVDNRCQKCGVVDGPCCADQKCNDTDAVCAGYSTSARCQKCGKASAGATSTPCCAGNKCTDGSCCVGSVGSSTAPSCVGVGNSCVSTTGTCGANGSCGTCGGLNQACCGTGSFGRLCSASGTTCVEAPLGTFTCTACGKSGERCCQQLLSTAALPLCEGALKCVADPGAAFSKCMP